MALRDQPYIPLYIQDIMTDLELNECCASTHGIFIKGIMCLMHKSETYGMILLKQKYKQVEQQNESKGYAFSFQLEKHLPYSQMEIYSAIQELIREKVCYYNGDYLCQKRMIRDNELSVKRAKAGKKGGETTQFAKASAKAKPQAPPENENVIENEVDTTIDNELKKNSTPSDYFDILQSVSSYFNVFELGTTLDAYKTISLHLTKIETLGEWEAFKTQFEAFKQYKSESEESQGYWKSFFGDFGEDGGRWRQTDWTKKIGVTESIESVKEKLEQRNA